MRFQVTSTIGPVLFLDDLDAGRMRLSALFITPLGEAPPPAVVLEGDEVTPICLARFDRAMVWRARFSLPADRTSSYGWNGATYEVAGDMTGALKVRTVLTIEGHDMQHVVEGEIDLEGSRGATGV